MADKSKPLTLNDLVITTITSESFTPQEAQIDEEGIAPLETVRLPQLVPAVAPFPSSIPVTRTRSYKISSADGTNTIPTDCFVQLFVDRVFVGISQNKGRIGNYLLCQADPSEVKPGQYEYEVSNLLGAREDPLLLVYARRIAEVIVHRMPPTASLTLVLGISLNKDTGREPDVFRAIMDILQNLYVEAVNSCQ